MNGLASPPIGHHHGWMLTERQRRRVFRIITWNQCLGMITVAFFQNGFFLNYFSKLELSSASIAFLFALPPLIGGLVVLPFAFLADRKGKLRLALIGQVMTIASVGLFAAAGWGPAASAFAITFGALALFSVGGGLQAASWFALLNPIVPAEIRGRFFGRLRFTFQTVTILCSLLITRLLEASDALSMFQWILGGALLAHVARYYTYARIPELEKEHVETRANVPFKAAFASVWKTPGFAAFNHYVFVTTLFVAGVPIIFGLMQKDVFGFSSAQITLMGTLFLGGSVAGNLLGGALVDRWGTRMVFLVTHVGFVLALCAMLGRHGAPWGLPAHVGFCSFFLGLNEAARGIAVTSEIMGLIPSANRSLSTAVCLALFNLGVAAAGLFVSRAIGWEVLAEEWTAWGRAYSAYDTLLFGFAAMMALMLVAIGLVPKVVKKAELLPGNGYPRV